MVTKISDIGVPGWLLKIVMAFLTDRKMSIRYKGKQSSGGGPQGTLLGLLLFIVLINDVGFDGQKNNTGDLVTSKINMKTANLMHLKFVDDLTLAEAINLPNKLKPIPANERPQSDTFHMGISCHRRTLS